MGWYSNNNNSSRSFHLALPLIFLTLSKNVRMKVTPNNIFNSHFIFLCALLSIRSCIIIILVLPVRRPLHTTKPASLPWLLQCRTKKRYFNDLTDNEPRNWRNKCFIVSGFPRVINELYEIRTNIHDLFIGTVAVLNYSIPRARQQQSTAYVIAHASIVDRLCQWRLADFYIWLRCMLLTRLTVSLGLSNRLGDSLWLQAS